MKCLIIAAGQGTRLKSKGEIKPLVTLLGVPLIERVIRSAIEGGADELVVITGYEGEQVSDIEATVEHLKRSSPDVFLTTVAYPIKGTKYYSKVESRIVSDMAWETQTDRDFVVNGRYSGRFYQHATRWMVNEVNLYKARQAGSRNYRSVAKMWLNARRGRIGMRMAAHERESAEMPDPGGRGWSAEDRAEEGW